MCYALIHGRSGPSNSLFKECVIHDPKLEEQSDLNNIKKKEKYMTSAYFRKTSLTVS